MANKIAFEPFTQTCVFEIIYENEESQRGVLKFNNDDMTAIYEFDSETKLFQVVQNFLALPNREDNFTFYTHDDIGGVLTNHKFFEISYFVPDRLSFILSSLQSRLIFLTTFQKESKEMINFLEHAIDYLNQQSQEIPEEELETLLDFIEEKIEILSDSQPNNDSGYISSTGTPEVETPDRVNTPISPEEASSASGPRGNNRAPSSLRNQVSFE